MAGRSDEHELVAELRAAYGDLSHAGADPQLADRVVGAARRARRRAAVRQAGVALGLVGLVTAGAGLGTRAAGPDLASPGGDVARRSPAAQGPLSGTASAASSVSASPSPSAVPTAPTSGSPTPSRTPWVTPPVFEDACGRTSHASTTGMTEVALMPTRAQLPRGVTWDPAAQRGAVGRRPCQAAVFIDDSPQEANGSQPWSSGPAEWVIRSSAVGPGRAAYDFTVLHLASRERARAAVAAASAPTTSPQGQADRQTVLAYPGGPRDGFVLRRREDAQGLMLPRLMALGLRGEFVVQVRLLGVSDAPEEQAAELLDVIMGNLARMGVAG